MADATTHDLEDYIPMLRKLDEVRKRSAALRDEGIEVLMECLHPPEENDPPPVFGDWRHENSLVIRALLTRHDQPFSKDKEKEKMRLKLIESLTIQLQNDLTLEELAEHELSVLVAASTLRALVAQPGAAFSETAMLCYYWIIRELYSADRSDWNIGGARAAPNGLVTAFTTGECIRALLSFIDALRNTSRFIDEASNYVLRLDHLNQLSKYYFPNDSDCPLKQWVEAEQDRLRLSYFLKFRQLSHYLVLALPLDQFEGIASVEKCLREFTDFKQNLSNQLKIAKDNFDNVLKSIIDYRKKEYGDETSSTSENALEACEEKLYGSAESDPPISSSPKTKADVIRSASAHLIAFQAVQDARKRAGEKHDLVEKCNGENVQTLANMCKDIKRGFDESAHQVEKLLHPVRNYLSSVLDRELALVSLGENWDWQPCELACAAASYGKLTKKWGKDIRFSRAVSDLSKMISSRGRFANLRHVHEQPDGPRIRMGNAAALHAMAQLLHHACDSEIETGLADNMLRFFEDTRAKQTLNIWLFSPRDITLDLIKKLCDAVTPSAKNQSTIPERLAKPGNEIDFKAGYILEKLSPETKKLFDLANYHLKIPGNDLPKTFSEQLAKRLSRELNELMQAHPFDGENFFNDEIQWAEATIKEKVERSEKYTRLRNWLCLQKTVLQELKDSDVERAVNQASSDKKGWDWEYSQPPLKTDLKATARAVMALAKINEMLDARINHIILEHFSVKRKNKGLNENLTLDSLFYPDYGLRLAPDAETLKTITQHPKRIKDKDWPKNGIQRQDSVAITLERMRAHVSGISLLKDDPLCSLVLHGPAGTGKTTLVEALAVSCDVRLVEVTPSDLVKYGEEDIEQRARAVFEALSMLTRAVILFDEFDPVLKRRKMGNNNVLNVFSFLTPGMLPKLKDLHNGAEQRSVAYVLVTNLIGELDEAAVRQGRFDKRLSIYPPDLLSRAGRFLDQIYPDLVNKPTPWDRIIEIIRRTEGKGMTALGQPGWFTRPKKEAKAKTPFAYVKDANDKFDDLEPDDELKDKPGEGRTAAREWLQWTWVCAWDEMLSRDAGDNDLRLALRDRNSLNNLLQQKFAQKLSDKTKEHNIPP